MDEDQAIIDAQVETALQELCATFDRFYALALLDGAGEDSAATYAMEALHGH